MSTRSERTAVIEELENEFRDASGIFLADNNKITVEQVTKLRSNLRKNGVHFIVVKNTLAREAANRVGKALLVPHFKGPTAIAITKNDVSVPAKVLKDFQKEFKDLLSVKAAMVDGTIFSGDDVSKLADLPSREVLLAQLLGCLQAPIGKFAGVLNGILSALVGTLEAVKDKKSQEQ